MSGTLRRKKGKTRLVSFFHQVRKENALKSIKAVKELELTDRKISKSLLSSKCTCMLFSQWECSHLQAVIQAATVLLKMLLSGMRLADLYCISYIFYCMFISRTFHCNLVSFLKIGNQVCLLNKTVMSLVLRHPREITNSVT